MVDFEQVHADWLKVQVTSVFRTLLNIKNETFCEKSLRLNALTVFAKRSILDI